ncbi:MAG: metallophosphoesterase family protein, partial [Candidatus Bathyarchaeia archaeon]
AGNIYPLTPYPALLVREGSERVLIVADLHIGWEMNLVTRGIHIPSQTARLQKRLLEVVNKARPSRLILLGDIKQAVPKITMEEWKAVPEFLETIQKVIKDILIVPGNHDGDIEPLTPSTIKLASPEGIVFGKKTTIAVFHGHAWPIRDAFRTDVLVMSHIHPVVWFRDRLGLWMVKQVWVKTICDTEKLAKAYLKYLNISSKKDPLSVFKERFGFTPSQPKLVIMPTFNDLLGGLPVDRLSENVSGPVVGSLGSAMAEAEIYLLDGTFLGKVKQFSKSRFEEQV